MVKKHLHYNVLFFGFLQCLYISCGVQAELSRPILKNLDFLGFWKNIKKPEKLGF